MAIKWIQPFKQNNQKILYEIQIIVDTTRNTLLGQITAQLLAITTYESK